MRPAMPTLLQPMRCKKSRRFMDGRIAPWAWVLADMLLLLQVPGVQWPALRTGVSRELCNAVFEVSHWCDQCDWNSFERSGSRRLPAWLDEPTQGELHVGSRSEPDPFSVHCKGFNDMMLLANSGHFVSERNAVSLNFSQFVEDRG